MSDPLEQRIAEALDARLDDQVFEHIAQRLLSVIYPSITPVTGGGDAGMDGHGQIGGEPFFLVCTTGQKALENLRNNLQSHRAAGGSIRRVVFATPRHLSGQQQANLQSQATKLGFDLVGTHAKSDFVELLYRNPTARKELLGIPGAAAPLAVFPSGSRPQTSVPLVGRRAELTAMETSESDLIVVGKPGIGKTYLLGHLAKTGWGLFDVNYPRAELEDGIRDQSPARIILDDAHLRNGRIAELLHVRQTMQADFHIVITCWPGTLEEIRRTMPEAEVVELAELDRDEILEVIEAAGLRGTVELQRLIVDQSHGLPGLAAMLATSCINGNVSEVIQGSKLFNEVVGWYERTIGRGSRAVLGVLALGGNTGVDLGEVAECLRMSIPQVSDLIRDLAYGGTVAEAPGISRLRIQPEQLQYALVANLFFGGAGSLSVSTCLKALTNPSVALSPLVGAAWRGADVPRHLLHELFEHSDDFGAAPAFAGLGLEEARIALRKWPQFSEQIAETTLKKSETRELSIWTLMERASSNAIVRGVPPTQSLKVLEEFLKGPRGTVDVRRQAIALVAKAARQSLGSERVLLRILAAAVYPGVRRQFTDPGVGRTVTLESGLLSSKRIDELERLWDDVLTILDGRQWSEISVMLDVLHSWVYPNSILFGGSEVPQEQLSKLRDRAAQVIGKLAGIWSGHPGVLSRLSRLSEQARLKVPIIVDRDFAAVFPIEWDSSSASSGPGASPPADGQIRALAERLIRMKPDLIANWIGVVEREATLASIYGPRLTPQLCGMLAEITTEPSELLLAMRSCGAPRDLLQPFLERLVKDRWDRIDETLLSLLSQESTRGVAVLVALTRNVSDPVRIAAAEKLSGDDRHLVEMLMFQRRIDVESIEQLIHHTNTVISRTAATIGLFEGSLPEHLVKTAEDIVVRSSADDHWTSVVLGRDPNLLGLWLQNWVARDVTANSDFESVPDSIMELVANLPETRRLEFIGTLPGHADGLYLGDVVAVVVGDNATVTRALLERDDLKSLHGAALQRGPSEGWMQRALVAIEFGWTAEQVVAETEFSTHSWWGEESQHWDETISKFRGLRGGDPARSSLIHAGIAFFEHKKARALKRERQERTFGM